jgi:carbon-monoxide dehydrogenase large subunit
MKANIYGEELVACVLARFLRARLAWVEDRSEHLVATAHSRDRHHVNRMVLDRDGRILGYADDFLVDLGAHNFWLGGVTANSAIHGLGPYRIPTFRMSGRAVVTNKTPTTQYRGAGRPEACFAVERLLDRSARELGLTPVEIRRRNLLGREDLPYTVGVPYHDGQSIVYDGEDYRLLLDRCVAEVERIEIAPEQVREGERIGVGYAMFAEGTGIGPYETARVSLSSSGRFDVSSGGASSGMGQETTLAQVAADELAVPIEAVVVGLPDTAVLRDGVGSYGSRTAANAGPAVQGAARALIEEGKRVVAGLAGEGAHPEDVHHDGAGFFHPPTETKLSWEELAQTQAVASTDSAAAVLEAEYRFETRTVTWVAGAHAAVVAVDELSGYPRVLGYVAVDEGGRSLNPMIVAGQVKGGIAQAIGGALMEEFTFDDAGQPLNTTLMDYLLPAATDIPRVTLVHVEAPSALNPLGVRGVGESGAIPGYAAIAAAVDDATRATHLTATPLNSELIARALDTRCAAAPDEAS